MARILMRPKDTDKLSQRFKSMARQLPNKVDEAMREAAQDMTVDFAATWDTWDHKPQAEITPRGSGNGYDVSVADDIWNMLNDGTRAHRIEPVVADRLAFQSSYAPKTRVGYVGSNSGGPSGDAVFAAGVDHPGTAARGWDKAIQKEWRSKVVKYVRDALKVSIESIGL